MQSNLLDGLPEPISIEAERAAIAAGDRETVVLGTMREAFKYACSCCKDKLPKDEVFSIAYKALEHASRNYKPGRGSFANSRFFGYAKVYVRGEICREWKRKDVVRNSSGHEEFSMVDESSAADQRVAADSCVTGAISRDADGPFGDRDLVPITDPDTAGIITRDMMERLAPIIKTRLTSQEQLVINLHYNQGMKFSEIAALLGGVRRQATQSTHDSAIAKLRCALRAGGDCS